ncbi:MAG TPA: hypothetical protein DCW68_00620 [Rhodospirillaceae bacterium]|nr:MAG: hypothetical protein A2018_00985 [Alphaproteobacteria bacterium GWF2_58_20]HAU28604.1 hypothetical protein [Rhodospirillaceae bacterium]
MVNITHATFYKTLEDPAWGKTREIAGIIPAADVAGFSIVVGLARSSLKHMQAMLEIESKTAQGRSGEFMMKAKNDMDLEMVAFRFMSNSADFQTPTGHNGPKRIMFLPAQLLWMASVVSDQKARDRALDIVASVSDTMSKVFSHMANAMVGEVGCEQVKGLLDSHAHAARGACQQAFKLMSNAKPEEKSGAQFITKKTHSGKKVKQAVPVAVGHMPTDWALRLMKV